MELTDKENTASGSREASEAVVWRLQTGCLCRASWEKAGSLLTHAIRCAIAQRPLCNYTASGV